MLLSKKKPFRTFLAVGIALVILALLSLLVESLMQGEGWDFLSNVVQGIPIIGYYLSALIDVLRNASTANDFLKISSQLLNIIAENMLDAALMGYVTYIVAVVVGKIADRLWAKVIAVIGGVAIGVICLYVLRNVDQTTKTVVVALLALVGMVFVFLGNRTWFGRILSFIELCFQPIVGGAICLCAAGIAVFLASGSTDLGVWFHLVLLPMIYVLICTLFCALLNLFRPE